MKYYRGTYLDVGTAQALELRSVSEGVSLGELIRRYITEGLERPSRALARRCLGCRCPMPTTNAKCPCCGRWLDQLPCAVCGRVGRFDTDLLVTSGGCVHDRCIRDDIGEEGP